MFLEARGDTAEVFDPVEEAFDAVAFLVKGLGKAVTMLTVDLVGNVRRRALELDPLPDPVGVVSLVAKQDAAIVEIGEQHRRTVDVMSLAGGERQLDRQAPRVGASDKALYRTRNVIERSFGRLKDYRRIATRFDKDVRNFFAALCIAVTVIWWI